MALFLSEDEQQFTDPVFSVGLGFIHKDKWLDIITALYSHECIEYYLFNKIRIWKES